MAEDLKEKCAVVGVITAENEINAAEIAYESLFAMQHRGSEASGIVTGTPEGTLKERRGLGMVVDVYNEKNIAELSSNVAVGHNRYSTSGGREGHPQPVIDEAIGLAFSLNGNLPVTDKLEAFLSKSGIRTQGINDTEMAGFAIAQHIRQGYDLPEAVEKTFPMLTGAFSCVAMHDGNLVAFRDSYGIRPLAIGSLDDGYVISSETCGLDIVASEYIREVEPGEMVIAGKGSIESRKIAEGRTMLDMFEPVYFARHDSRLYDQDVNEMRRHFGEQLAKEHPPIYDDGDNILVVPVPDTSIPAAEGYADAYGLRHHQAIIKNRYIGRTFMQPGNKVRHKQLRRKHNIVKGAVEGKDIILIDDSIVRGNTMPLIVELAYSAGARSVSVLIHSSPVRFPDFYGIDTPSQNELLAANLNNEQMRQRMSNGHSCKKLGFLSLEGMISSTGLSADKFNLSCFTGKYPIDIGERNNNEIYKPVSMEGVE